MSARLRLVPGAGPFSVLTENKTYRTYWLGQLVSMTGSWMQQVAQSWVVVSLTRSTAAIATLSFVASLPMLALTMPGGVLADKHDRRRILIITQLLFAALAFVYAGLYASGHLNLAWVYVLAIGLAIVMAFDFPALQALIPDLVPPPQIPDAVALGQTLMHGTRLIGPALAGLLMAATSPAGAFAGRRAQSGQGDVRRLDRYRAGADPGERDGLAVLGLVQFLGQRLAWAFHDVGRIQTGNSPE